MSERQANPRIDAWFGEERPWAPEMRALREIALGRGLAEAMKWGWPCYQDEGRNIVLIHAFKDYCALLFFKGALMSDPEGWLVRQTENVQAPRQIRFAGLDEVKRRGPGLRAYIEDAVAVGRSGRTLERTTAARTPSPPELDEKLAASPALKTAFAALTPGRRRAYLLHFNSAKQAKTRVARIEKCTPLILAGKGLDD